MSKAKPNVLFLPKWYPNRFDAFDGNFIENHAHAVKKYANVYVLFVHSDPDLDEKFDFEKNENQGIKEYRVYFKKAQSGISWLDKFLTGIFYLKAQKAGFDKILEDNVSIDLCHIHVLSRTAPLALELKKKHAIPFGITEHWSGYLKENQAYKGILKKKFTEKAVAKSSFISPVSSNLKAAMQSHGLESNYEVIPNVVDTNMFTPGERKAEKTEVLFVGNLLQSPKRILDIIRIVGKIAEKRKDFVLNIYGEGKEEEECRKIIRTCKWDTYIKLKGTATREKIAEIMGQSAFLFLFSEFENQPCVINEAQSCGLPVVVPDIPGIKELMQENLGILYKWGNKEEFAAAFDQMLDHYKKYDREEIREYAVEHFSEKVIGKRFLSLYQKALQKV